MVALVTLAIENNNESNEGERDITVQSVLNVGGAPATPSVPSLWCLKCV